MEKRRDLFKKTGDNKGTFHAKMGTIKDRNGNNLTEPEEIKRGGKNILKKSLVFPILLFPSFFAFITEEGFLMSP